MKKQTSGGMSLCGVLFVIFLVLKLCHVIDWSWLWVLSPLWLPTALIIGGALIFFLFYFLYRILH